MNYWQRLWRVELIGLAALLIFALAVSVLFAVENLVQESPAFDVLGAAFIGFWFTFAIGIFPVVLFGSPIYSFYVANERFSGLLMFAIALLPGIVLSFLDLALGVFAIVGGASVLALVHMGYRRWASRPFASAT